ncbi:MAG: CBS domain-containing protein, partial [Anaerolineae bacterium]|nr:CBS domain-containing protein [Anaerolineae bacterium]
TTLLVELIREERIPLSSLESTLLALGIYADTGMLTYGGTTPRDLQAAAWLLDHGAVLDTVQRFLTEPLNNQQQNLFEILLKNAESRSIQGYEVTLASATQEEVIGGISTVTTALSNTLDSDAVFVLVQMPKNIQLVCRSREDAIDSGELARELGGGGHPRAAAAAIYKGELSAIIAQIWDWSQQHIQPAVRVADLMSYGVQTVSADEPIAEGIARLRRIGHEGYPVLDANRVVGLLTLRDADKALEHGLKEATMRDVMLSGTVTLTPHDSVARLEEVMVASDWGQIPVVDEREQLIGIVTRTDLIKHWAQKHPARAPETPHIELASAEQILGISNIALIETVSALAQKSGLPLYMVGGVVRDLLLERPNYDIDFVVEADAITFVESLAATYGGDVHSYRPFGTAKWLLDETAAEKLGVKLEQLPDHLDFATARSELYEHPTALPTVYNSGIKLDLRRRDFTINTLAVQLSPQGAMWRVLDFYGGLHDLERGMIRVLHSLSFVDDPTRIIRAVRFAQRLN